MKCFYHSADLDGHCSGAIIKKFNPKVELIGYNYGQEFPWDSIQPGEQVFMVDVSLPMPQMYKLASMGTLYWIDHHISAINDHEEQAAREDWSIKGLRRTDRAACELCWEWCAHHEPVPPVVYYLGIYDSWRFEDYEERVVKAFQYGMRTLKETRPEHSMMVWEGFFSAKTEQETILQEIFTRGRTIFDYQLVQNEKTCRACAFETDLHDYAEESFLKCIAVNSNLGNSDVFRSVYDPEKHDAMLIFYRSKRGFWRVSIYSTHEEVDCSRYAKAFDGGGHKGAAGFQCQELPFELTKMD